MATVRKKETRSVQNKAQPVAKRGGKSVPKAKPTKRASKGRPTPAKPTSKGWELRLYVAGQTPRCVEAFAQLKRICEEHLAGRYSIEVIDLLQNPTLAAGDQIIAIPTLVRKLPTPMKRIIGDLTNAERVIVGLNLTPQKTAPNARAT